MKNYKFISIVFSAAAIFDGLLGMLFLFFPLSISRTLGASVPDDMIYVQFPALLMLVFAIMFLSIALFPERNKNLFIYAILGKLSFVVIFLANWLLGNFTGVWMLIAFADLVFAVLFYFSYRRLIAVLHAKLSKIVSDLHAL